MKKSKKELFKLLHDILDLLDNCEDFYVSIAGCAACPVCGKLNGNHEKHCRLVNVSRRLFNYLQKTKKLEKIEKLKERTEKES